MIKYRKQNALEPEKDAEVSVNLTPLLFFAVGFFTMKAVLGSVLSGRGTGAAPRHGPYPDAAWPG